MAKPHKQYPQKPQQPQQQAQAKPIQEEQVGQLDVSDSSIEAPVDEVVVDEAVVAEEVSTKEAAVEAEAEQAGVVEDAPEVVEEPTPVFQATDLGTQDASSQAPADAQASTSVEVTEPAPVPEEAKPVEEERALSEEEAYLEKIRESGTPKQKRILAAIETFVELFNPKKPLSAEAAVAGQHELLQHLLWLLKKEYEVFKGGWNALLVYFAVHHGNPSPAGYSALSEYSAHRARHAWAKSPDLLLAFENLIAVLRATRVKATRPHDVKRLAFDKIGSEAITEQGLSNLKKFYNV